LSDAQKARMLRQKKEMLTIWQESEKNDFDDITTGDEFWFQHSTASLKMFARSAADVIRRTRQTAGAKETLVTVFFTAEKLITLPVLPRGSPFSQPDFINNIFPDLKTANLIFRRQKTGSAFWMHMNNAMCHRGSKAISKIQKNHISRMPRPPYSPDISLCYLWLFGMLKQILRDREFFSSDEIKDAIAQLRNDLTFDDVQSVFQDWTRRLAWVAENDGEYSANKTRSASSWRLHVEIGMARGLSGHP
jgi:hypothetical protein